MTCPYEQPRKIVSVILSKLSPFYVIVWLIIPCASSLSKMSDIEVAPWLKSLPLAPEYRPTEAEFADPIAYIFKIEAEARQYGICKIIPPFVKAPKKTVIANLNRSLTQSADVIPAGFYGSVSGMGRSMTGGSMDTAQVDSMACVMSDSNVCFGDQKAKFTTRRQQLGCNSKRSRGQMQNLAQKLVWQSGERYTVEQFEAKAKQFARSRLGTSKELSPLAIETLFWRAANDKPITIEYGNDIPGSAFAKPVTNDTIVFLASRGWGKKRKRELSRHVHSDESTIQTDNAELDMYDRSDGGEDGSSIPQPKLVQRKEDAGLHDGEGDSGQQCTKLFEKVPDSDNVKSIYPKSVGSGLIEIEREDIRSRATGADIGLDKGTAGWKLANSAWNMQVVARSSGSLLRYMPEEVPGVTSPMVYIGMLFSWFAWHVEDHELHSLNYLHMGASKTWYAVPGDIAPALEEVVQVHGYGCQLKQPAAFVLLGEKTTVMSPQVLIAAGVPCCRLVQNAGEFVVTFPRAYHLGFSHGFNCGEAVNFATPGWLEVAKEAAIRRAAMNYLPMVSHQQLLYLSALSFPSRLLMHLPSEPWSSRLRDKKRSDGEEFVKREFVNDVAQNNQFLGLLLDMGAKCCLLMRDGTYSSSGPTCTSDAFDFSAMCATEAMDNSRSGTVHDKCWNPVQPGQERLSNCSDRFLNDFAGLSGEILAFNGNTSKLQGATKSLQLLNDSTATDFDLEWGTLPCAACGILCFASVAVVQPASPDAEAVGPSLQNTNNLPSYFQSNSTVKRKCELDCPLLSNVSHVSNISVLPSVCMQPLASTLENKQVKILVDSCNEEKFSSELHFGESVSTKDLFYKNRLQPYLGIKDTCEMVNKVIKYSGHEKPDTMASTSAVSNSCLKCSKQLDCRGNVVEMAILGCGDESAQQVNCKESIPSFAKLGDDLMGRSSLLAEPLENPAIEMLTKIDDVHLRNAEISCTMTDSSDETVMGNGTGKVGQHSRIQKYFPFVAAKQKMVSNVGTAIMSTHGHLSGAIVEHSITAGNSGGGLKSLSKPCGSTDVLVNAEFEGSDNNAVDCPPLSALELLAATYDDASEPDEDNGGGSTPKVDNFPLSLWPETVFPSEVAGFVGVTVDAPQFHVGSELILAEHVETSSRRDCSLKSNISTTFPLKCLDEDLMRQGALQQSAGSELELKERQLAVQCSTFSNVQVTEPAKIFNLEDMMQLPEQTWDENMATSQEVKLSLCNQSAEIFKASQQTQEEKYMANAEGSKNIYEDDNETVSKESLDIKALISNSVKDLPERNPGSCEASGGDNINRYARLSMSSGKITSMRELENFVSCKNFTRPRLLCLEHAIEAQRLLLQFGGCDVFIVCHSRLMNIEEHAKHLASELSMKHQWRNILLRNATHEERKKVQMALDVGDDGEQDVSDWVDQLGMSVQSFRDKDKLLTANSLRMLSELYSLGSKCTVLPIAGRELFTSFFKGNYSSAPMSGIGMIGETRNGTKVSKQKKVMVAGRWCGRVWMNNQVHPSLGGSLTQKLSLPSIHPLASSLAMAENKQNCVSQKHIQEQPIQHAKRNSIYDVSMRKFLDEPSIEVWKDEKEDVRDTNIDRVGVTNYWDSSVGFIKKRRGKKRKSLEVGKDPTELQEYSAGQIKNEWSELDPELYNESVTDNLRLPYGHLRMLCCRNILSNASRVHTGEVLELDFMDAIAKNLSFPVKVSSSRGNFGMVGFSASTGDCIDGDTVTIKDSTPVLTSACCSVAPMATVFTDQILFQPFDCLLNPLNVNHQKMMGIKNRNTVQTASGCAGILQRRACSTFESQTVCGSNADDWKKRQILTCVNTVEVDSVNSELTRVRPTQINAVRSQNGKEPPETLEGKSADDFDKGIQCTFGLLMSPKKNLSQQSSDQKASLDRHSDSSSDSDEWRLLNALDVECSSSACPSRSSGKIRSKRKKRRHGIRMLPSTDMEGAHYADISTPRKRSMAEFDNVWQKQVESDRQLTYYTRLSAGGPGTRPQAKCDTIEDKRNSEETEAITVMKTKKALGIERKKVLKLQKAANGKVIIKDAEQEEAYLCDIDGCNMSFPTGLELSMHKRNMCTVTGCGKDFGSHKYLLQHRRVHLDDRPLKCTWKGCKMTFKWAWARTEHYRVHTGERPYKCAVPGCGQTFRFVSDFSRHKRNTGHMK